MDRYSKKYGFDGQSPDVRSFHRQRRMFVVKDSTLVFAPIGSPLSHAEWFESLGWMGAENDLLMETVTRGYVDSSGVYAYTGYDFRVTDTVRQDVLAHIDAISKGLNLSPTIFVYLGLTKPAGGQSTWIPTEKIGTIKSLTLEEK